MIGSLLGPYEGLTRMPRTTPTRKPQIAEALCARVDKVCAAFDNKLTFNAATELLLQQMLDLIESSPELRRTPPIAAALDAIKAPKTKLSSGEDRVSSVASGLLGAAVAQAKKSPK